jgi:hypothetical protein
MIPNLQPFNLGFFNYDGTTEAGIQKKHLNFDLFFG